MGRPIAHPYMLGRITTRPHPTKHGEWQARGRYRDANNLPRDATASGKTAPKARRALELKVKDAEQEYVGGDASLNQNTSTGTAVRVWLDQQQRKRRNGRTLSPNTLSQYSAGVERYVIGSAIEHLPLSKANDINRISKWLSDIADKRGEGAARSARKVLSGTLALAEQRGAIPISVMHRVSTPGASGGSAGDRMCRDDVCDRDCGKRHSGKRRALTAEQARAVFDVLANESRYGIGATDVADLVHFLFGTGARISEALHAVRWTDVDLTGRTVRIRGTKTQAADRTVAISTELAERLAARKQACGDLGLVFGVTRYPSKAGQPRDQNNVQRAIRNALREAGFNWAATHTFRRTVATWMDDGGAPLAEIAAQLGHANTSVTHTYLASAFHADLGDT